MPSPSALACLRCGARNALDQYGSDSAACRAAQAPPNLTLLFATAPGRGLDRDRLEAKPASLWRWASFLPAAEKDAVSLGEATRRCGLRLRSASAKCGPTRLAKFEGLGPMGRTRVSRPACGDRAAPATGRRLQQRPRQGYLGRGDAPVVATDGERGAR